MVRGFHDIAVGSGWVQPRDFWRDLTPGEIWWAVQARLPEQAPGPPRRLYRMLKEARAREAAEKAREEAAQHG